jgi:RES domain-containing protein
MKLYRITRERHAYDLSGKGGLLSSARWHDHMPVIYASVNSSTSILEKLVHMQQTEIHHDLVMVTLLANDDWDSEIITTEQLRPGWDNYPAPLMLKQIGNAWLSGVSSPMLFVPSVIDKYAQNVLINPLHPVCTGLNVIETIPFTFDTRLK